jgi:hypothetical protein
LACSRSCTLDFIREHLARKNQRGSILFTTRTESVGSFLACAAGQQHQVVELGLPDAQDALLAESALTQQMKRR